MTEGQKIVFIQSQIACAQIEMESMKAENIVRAAQFRAPAYYEKHFLDLIAKYSLDHDAVMIYLNS